VASTCRRSSINARTSARQSGEVEGSFERVGQCWHSGSHDLDLCAHHDKYLVVDGVTVQTGSFNYTDSAARRNSENVVVLWNYPNVAKDFLVHWQSRFDQGVPYVSAY